MTIVTPIASATEVEVDDVVAFYQHGWHSWCDTRWLPASTPRVTVPDPRDRMGHDDPVHALDTTPGGSGLGAVEHSDGSVTLLGALEGGAWVRFDGRRLVAEYEDAEGPFVTLRGPEIEVFERYASLLADHLGRRGGNPPRLWSSWYSFYEDVSEALMRDTIAGLDGVGVDVVEIDDGWQQAIGDWVANDSFPSGMTDVAERIRATGRRAGIWLAPFIAAPDSQVAVTRPELILRDDHGDPVVAGINWGSPYYALDVTHPETLDHLAAVFRGLTDAGYDFFKLDFIYAAAWPGAHEVPTSRSAAYRNACVRIRETVGDDAYLLACGGPILESIGVFDGLRIGPDVGPVWADGTYSSSQRAMATSLHRLWLRPAIDVDPDVVYFGGTELGAATLSHLQALARAAGFRGTSDPPGRLTPREVEAMRNYFDEAVLTRQSSRYTWEVGDRHIDFAPAVTAVSREPDWELVG